MAINRPRRNGSYAALSAHYYMDDRVSEVGEAAELLFVRGLAFCASMLTDGVISERQARTIVGMGLDHIDDRAKALVAAGLWEHDRDAAVYRVRSWLKWNRSRDEISYVMSRDAARKRHATPDEQPEQPPNDPPNGIRTESNGIPDTNTRNVTTRNDTHPPCPKGQGREGDTHARDAREPPPIALAQARERIADAAAAHKGRQRRRPGGTP